MKTSQNKSGPGLYTLPMVMLAALLVMASPALAGIPQDNCLLDKAGLDKAPCSAGDDQVISFSVAGDPIECMEGHFVPVTLRAVVESTASERYDPGFFVALDGGDAKHGTCQEAYFMPPLTTCSIDDADQGNCTDPYNPGDGEPPFLNLETDVPEDTCGDQEQGIQTAFNFNAVIPCSDPDGNGMVELSTCLSWENQGGPRGNLCTVEIGPILGTGSKCRCEAFPVEGITVVPDPCEDVVCDDGVTCTLDACNSETGECVFTPDDALCDDGDVCTGTATCNAELDCQAGIPLMCDDGVACTVDLCVPFAGCDNSPDDALCGDDNICNGIETCHALDDCQAGQELDCNDAVACTVDSCDPTDGCLHDPTDSLCDDNNVCNGAETCDEQDDCQAGQDLNCDDGVDCTIDSCDVLGGCGHLPDDGLCDDQDVCTGTELCDALLDCQAGTPLDCDDDVGCTDDACDALNGCSNTPNAGNCGDGVFCTDEECDPVDDCQFVPNDDHCDDGVDCTDDICDAQQGCGSEVNDGNCDDGYYCTIDICDVIEGCSNTADDALCNDERLCTEEACLVEDPASAPSGCRFDFVPDVDPEACPVEICRTPGFWGNHSQVIQELLDAGYAGFPVCGVPVENVLIDHESSALEGVCNRPRGDKVLTAARHLVSTALNCILTNGNADCVGTTVEDDFVALDAACAAGDRHEINQYQSRVDCWNNGGDLGLYDQFGWCVKGFCDGIPGEFCGSGGESCQGQCIPFADSCHEQPLINDALSFYFEPAGQYVRQRLCNKANRNECTLPYVGDCGSTP